MTYLLINKQDINNYRHIADNIDTGKRLDMFIQEAQELDLKPVLNSCGTDFLYDIEQQASQQTVPVAYDKLLNGTEYTQSGKTFYFHGLKPVLVYFTWARFLANQQQTVSSHGIVAKTSDYSEHVDEKTLARLITQARSAAVKYAEEMINYLNAVDDFALWGGSNSTTDETNTSTKITAIG